MRKLIFILTSIVLTFTLHAQKEDLVLIEAESFTNKGGWLLDQQFMDQMGSPFLLAHGMGTPVANASTETKSLKKGVWHVYVRTWNWCSPWETSEAPGKFKIMVNDTQLQNELGTGQKWDWEYAGTIDITQNTNTVSLIDLTGFEGRCDAIVFSRSKETILPNEKGSLAAFRKKQLRLPEKTGNGGSYDLVVVGGGLTGLSTAITGARKGLKVALIHNRPVTGGNNSTEIKVVASGKMNQDPYPVLGNTTKEIRNVYNRPQHVDSVMYSENNLSVFLNMHVFSLEKQNNKIISVTAKHIENSKETKFSAPLFVDCTGDGNLGFLAGADYLMGREMRGQTRETLAPDRPDNVVLGATISWNSKVNTAQIDFPECKWAIQFNDESCEKVTAGSNWWETGFKYDQVNDAEYIRDYLFRAIYGNWAFLKNKSKHKDEYKNRTLNWMTYVAGKRESRRLIGDILFKQQDIEGDYIKYNDAIVTGTYSIDQHFPTPKNSFFFPGEEFISTMKHGFNDLGTPRRYLRDDQVNSSYRIPYRSLYSVNIDNLFMAGRNISVSHIALSSTRVNNTTGMMGELVAIAATLCKKHNCTPREIYTKHLNELLSLLK